MGDSGHIIPPNLESSFHEFDRVLRQNLSLRRVHGPLEGDADRSPTGVTLARLHEENQRMRAALERRGIEPPRVTEGAVQPATLVAHPRRHVPVDDPKVCPQCGDLHRGRVCRCGYAWSKGLRRGGTGGRVPIWDANFAWAAGTALVLAGLFWALQPFFR